MSYEEWFNKLPNDYKEWVHRQGLLIRNREHPTKLAYRAWKHLTEKLEKAEEYKRYYDSLFSQSIVIPTEEYTKMVEEASHYKKVLKKMAGEDFRGNRPSHCSEAYYALEEGKKMRSSDKDLL